MPESSVRDARARDRFVVVLVLGLSRLFVWVPGKSRGSEDVTVSWSSRYGGTVGAGDLNGDGTAELLAASGPDPAAPSTIHPYVYLTRPIPLYAFDAFPGVGYGVNVAAADLG